MIGIIVAVVALVICSGVGAWIYYRRRKEALELNYTQSDQMSIASGASGSAAPLARSVHSEAPSVNNYF